MSDDARRRHVRLAVTVSAILLGGLGVALVFAPVEIGERLSIQATPPVLNLLGAALLGFGLMNWTARGSTLGGIYGRAIVVGNQMHLTVGALALLKHASASGGSPAYWAFTAVYVLGAALFLHLMFSGGPSET
jgi:hypothetical protein